MCFRIQHLKAWIQPFHSFELMFNHDATLPIDLEIKGSTPEEELACYDDMEEPEMEALQRVREQKLDEALANIQKAQRRQKEQYDKKHAKPDLFKKGQLVLKKDHQRKKRKGSKLEARFVGLYVILKKLGKVTYQLKAVNGAEVVRATGAHLKPYRKPSLVKCWIASTSSCFVYAYVL